jgi:ABC-type multidrug transport system fused ATPase/permease subunit
LESSLESARRLFEIVDTRLEVSDPVQPLPAPNTFGLWVQNLSFRYPVFEARARQASSGQASEESPFALERISFDLEEGKRLAVVGPSGSGKSTLVHLLLRFWEYERGEITLGGKDLRRYRADDLRRAIGVVSQNAYLFNASLRENLLVAFPKASEAQLVRAAQLARLHDFILSLPEGYDTWIGEHGLRLSAGERQRLAIARALLKDPPLLILDEATANLDAITEREVLGLIQGLMRGRTTLMITHRLAGLETMDEILVLSGGRIAERGRHAELLAARGMYQRMWALQNGRLEEATANWEETAPVGSSSTAQNGEEIAGDKYPLSGVKM